MIFYAHLAHFALETPMCQMLFLEFHLIIHTPASIRIGLALFGGVISSVLWAEKHQYPKSVQEPSWERQAGS